MNPLIRLKGTTVLLFVVLVTVYLGLSPTGQTVVPPPDGGYPGFNTAEGQNALFSLTTGAGNTAVGWYSLFSNTDGSFNTALGAGTLLFNTANQNTALGTAALLFNTTGQSNTGVGSAALLNNTTGAGNTATGTRALTSNTIGSQNTAIGYGALSDHTTGVDNIGLGFAAGSALTTGSQNIDIGNVGTADDSGTIRIGDIAHTRTFIAGIRGVAVTGSPVVVSSSHQLGVMPSSQRFKEDIKPMDQSSEAILALKPVSFHYTKDIDPNGAAQFGLVAEEVEKINPDLVVRDAKGEVYTVRYDAVNAMLLNEFLKAHRRMEEQDATIARQQKQIDALAAGLNKVSAQVKLTKSAPQTVLNNH